MKNDTDDLRSNTKHIDLEADTYKYCEI